MKAVAFALLAVGLLVACRGKQSLGADCVDPTESCAGQACGSSCSACSTGSLAAADVVGQCGSDRICRAEAATCGPVSTGGQGGAGGSPGCGKTGVPSGVLTGQTITVAGQPRTYVLSVPAAYTGTSPLALVFAWHGANVDGSLARNKIFNLEATANGAAIFVYPDGSGAAAWDTSPGSVDFQIFPTLLAAVSSSYCIDANRIFSTGHSTGAMMTNDLGCYYGDLLRAIAPVEGTPPNLSGRAGCTGQVAAMIVHGQNDPVIPFSQGQATRDFWLSRNGCASQTATWAPQPACLAYQGCQADLPVLWCVHDEEHAWPTLGADCTGGICFEAGPAIWAFFSSFH